MNVVDATTFTNPAIGAIEFFDDGLDTFIRSNTSCLHSLPHLIEHTHEINGTDVWPS